MTKKIKRYCEESIVGIINYLFQIDEELFHKNSLVARSNHVLIVDRLSDIIPRVSFNDLNACRSMRGRR